MPQVLLMHLQTATQRSLGAITRTLSVTSMDPRGITMEAMDMLSLTGLMVLQALCSTATADLVTGWWDMNILSPTGTTAVPLEYTEVLGLFIDKPAERLG